MAKTYYIFAGANGVGKSTLYSLNRVPNEVKELPLINDDDIIRRRYNKSLENLNKVINLCDSIIIYDNTYEFKKLAEIDKGKLLYYSNPTKYQLVK